MLARQIMMLHSSVSGREVRKPSLSPSSGAKVAGNEGVTVYILDDDRAVLTALTRLVTTAGYAVKPFASAREFLTAHDPDQAGCAIVDFLMPDHNGLEVQRILHAAGRSVVFITGTQDVEQSVEAMKAGAIDVLTKPIDRENLLRAIEKATHHDREMRLARKCAEDARGKLLKLTAREAQVLRHVIAGRLSKQIAHDLGTVEKTIKVHRGRISRKLAVSSVADLVRLATAAGVKPFEPGEAGERTGANDLTGIEGKEADGSRRRRSRVGTFRDQIPRFRRVRSPKRGTVPTSESP
jgi:FixJ family two-component response regulator